MLLCASLLNKKCSDIVAVVIVEAARGREAVILFTEVAEVASVKRISAPRLRLEFGISRVVALHFYHIL